MADRYKVWVVWWIADAAPQIVLFMAEHRARECYERTRECYPNCGFEERLIYPEVRA